jgi:hypothetical protein
LSRARANGIVIANSNSEEECPVQSVELRQPGSRPPQKLSFECSVCTYGIVRRSPPEICPMCRSSDTWVHVPSRPFSRDTS